MAKCFAPYGWAQEGKHGSFPSVYKGSLILPRPPNMNHPFLGHGSFSSSSSSSSSSVVGRSTEGRVSTALKIHSQAEKRRRERINGHLSTLRRMIPETNKMDKAALLGRVIEQVKDLKRKAVDIGKGFTLPAEVDEVSVECHPGDEQTNDYENHTILQIKASVCCDDRPNLFADLIQVFHGLRLRTIRADITSLGGRVLNIFILCGKESNGSVCLNSVKESIKEVLVRVASSDTNTLSAKRQRLLQSHYSNWSL